MVTNLIQEFGKKIIHHGYGSNICQPINIIYHINRLRDKDNVIILSVAEKAFDKIYCSFMIKVLEKLGIKGTNLNTIKTVYSKSTTNIILNREK